MYELKKNGNLFTGKYVGNGPSSYEKNNVPGRGFTKVVKHCFGVGGRNAYRFSRGVSTVFVLF